MQLIQTRFFLFFSFSSLFLKEVIRETVHSLCDRQISQTYISDKSGKVVSWEPKSCVSKQDSGAGLALTK